MTDLTQEEKDINARFIEAYEFLGFPNKRSGKTMFCNSINLNTATFSKVESNKRPLPRHYLANMETTHGISALWLATGQGSMTVDKKGTGNNFTSSGAVSGGQNLTGWGTQTSFNPQGLDLVTAFEKDIANLQGLLAEKDKQLAEKDERIKELKEMLEYFKSKS
jgi:hypothetical protein